MNQEQKRIKLAEAAGEWIPSKMSKGKWCHKNNYSMSLNGAYSVWVGRDSLPNYFNDLNAIHELRSKLTDRQKEVFAYYLAFSELPDGYIGYIELPPIDTFDVINSPADVQAEALGKTLNLW